MRDIEPRLTPARSDLAAERLRGRVEAARFVPGVIRRVAAPVAPLRRSPRSDAPLDTEALAGDVVTVYEETIEGWAWGELDRDGYVGYLPADMLGPADPAPTHHVTALKTFVYPAAEMKLPPLAALPLGAGVTVVGETEKRGLAYALLASGHAVVARHLAPLEAAQADFVAAAERLIGVPYLWGGTSSFGIDCSGLVQLALRLAGRTVLRDTDLQERTVGAPVAIEDGRLRGDLLFWPGHVAIMLDDTHMIHASGFHMEVVVEDVATAAARIAAGGVQLSSVRRL